MTDDELILARSMAAFGASRDEIAEAIGQHPASVWRNADKIGLKVRRISPKTTFRCLDARGDELLILWDSGEPLTVVANAAGCSRKLARRWLEKHGREVTRRPARGSRCGRWRGGRGYDSSGYVWVWIPRGHKFECMARRDRQVAEHRLVMARHLDRPLTREETVHHKDGVKDNNVIKNLQLRRKSHGPGQVLVCAVCGSNNIQAKDL